MIDVLMVIGGHKEALICLNVVSEIDELPFWKRNKAWRAEEGFILNKIVNPINCMIRAYEESSKIIEKEERDNGIN